MAQAVFSSQPRKSSTRFFPDFDSDCDADLHVATSAQQQLPKPDPSIRRFPDTLNEHDKLESKLRLLDVHRQQALERCEEFMCEMESAIQKESRLAAFPASKPVAARPLPSASPSWLADQSYYQKQSSRRTSVSGSVTEVQNSCSSSGRRRRSSSRRSSWAADPCEQGSGSSGRGLARCNPWAAE